MKTLQVEFRRAVFGLGAVLAGISSANAQQEVLGAGLSEVRSVFDLVSDISSANLWDIRFRKYVWDSDSSTTQALAIFEPYAVSDDVCRIDTISIILARSEHEENAEQIPRLRLRQEGEDCAIDYPDFETYTTVYGDVSADDYSEIISLLQSNIDAIRQELPGVVAARSNTIMVNSMPDIEGGEVSATLAARGCQLFVTFVRMTSKPTFAVGEMGYRVCPN